MIGFDLFGYCPDVAHFNAKNVFSGTVFNVHGTDFLFAERF
jgi:hypothetical protein